MEKYNTHLQIVNGHCQVMNRKGGKLAETTPCSVCCSLIQSGMKVCDAVEKS